MILARRPVITSEAKQSVMIFACISGHWPVRRSASRNGNGASLA